MVRRCFTVIGLLVSLGFAQTTEIQYLSGTGSDDTKTWEFFCTGGRRSGEWSSIEVPSNWEFQGFGTYNYGRERKKADEQGRYRTEFSVPLSLTLPESPSLMLKTSDSGRAIAAESLRMAMLRALQAMPAGKLRFTIIDPTGLGQNFSALMHLADFDERSVSSRIWTETSHINQRLTDLTAHMEDVIQKYLRNEFRVELLHIYICSPVLH